MGRERLSHVDEAGRVRMVDVSGKAVSERRALAAGRVSLGPEALQALRDNRLGKGDALATARIAGIQAAKRTSEWVPLCHTVPLDQVDVTLDLVSEPPGVEIRATARARAVTGVEMEALVAVTAAALALYDMVKAVDRAAVIGPVGVLEKSGGRTGRFARSRDDLDVVSGPSR